MLSGLALISPILSLAGPLPVAAQRRLKPAYAASVSLIRPVRAFYREVETQELPRNSFVGVGFKNGHVGLQMEPERRVVLYVKGNARLIEASRGTRPASRRLRGKKKGLQAELDFPWEPLVRYKIFVHTEIRKKSTIYSAWIGQADEETWELIGRVKRRGRKELGLPVGFIKQIGTKKPGEPRAAKFGRDWIYDGATWTPSKAIEVLTPDPRSADAWKDKGMAMIKIQEGLRARHGRRKLFQYKRFKSRLPVLPTDGEKN